MTPRGFEPLLPPWKGGVLTAWPWSLASSPSRARTYNNSVNSRVLYHWAIEEYLLNYRCQLSSQRHVISYHIFIVLSTTFVIFFACTLKTAHKLFISNLLPFPTLTFWSSPRPISSSQLHALQHFHPCPINLVVFKGSYSYDGISHLEGGFTLRCLQR